MNIQAYLNRIGCSTVSKPDLPALRHLQKQHLLHIPFENLDIHYGVPIRLDTENIFQKVVYHKRGGFCYELNELFLQLLRTSGFTVRRISARVYDNKKEQFGPEYDHLAVIVLVDGTEYLADVGFGEFAFAPLEMEPGVAQQDVRGTFVIKPVHKDELVVNIKDSSGDEVPKYIFQNIAREYSEFSGMCRYHQTNSESPFTRNKLISIPTENGRITLTDNKLTTKEHGNTNEVRITDESGFNQKLKELFGIVIT
ncbi:arylamine N-acetyltransferase family protein [Sinomicrobium sp. M5D2P17]